MANDKLIMQIDRETFEEISETIKKGEEAISAAKYMQVQLGILENAIRTDQSITYDDTTLLIDSIPLAEYTESLIKIIVSRQSQKDKHE